MNLEATDIKQTSAMLSWSPPENDGGSEILHYIVEKREIDRKTWATVKTEVEKDKIPYKVSGLMPGTEYYFRVTAVNEYGSGVPRVSATSYLASDPVSKYLVFKYPDKLKRNRKTACSCCCKHEHTYLCAFFPFFSQVNLIPVRRLRCWRSQGTVQLLAGLNQQEMVVPRLMVM